MLRLKKLLPPEASERLWMDSHPPAREYPTTLRRAEETQFQLTASQHFIFVLAGELEVLDPNSDVTYRLGPREALSVARDPKKEFRNLRAAAASETASCLWVVI